MFWPDVSDLRRFYSTALGQVSCRILRKKIKQCWPEFRGEVVLGIGYSPPYLQDFQSDAKAVFALMPASQGVIHWPNNSNNQTLLAHEAEMPFPDHSIDKILIVHALENSDHSNNLIEEVERVLVPGGKVIIIAPNRGGLWARLENNPFGLGRPYSAYQATKLLNQHSLTVLETCYALYNLPTQSRFFLRITDIIESIGPKLLKPLAGVVVISAEKQVYAVRPIKVETGKVRRPEYVPATVM